jgi:hypothetical protein
VQPEKPFLSETGCRSFLGCDADIVRGITPETFCAAMIDAHIKGERKRRLRSIEQRYRAR